MDADSTNQEDGGADALELPPEIILDVAEKFCPLRADVSDSWRTSLKQLQERFGEIAQDQPKLICVLTQSVVPEWPTRPDGPHPPEVEGMEPVAMGGGPSRWPQQFFRRSEDGSETIVSQLKPMSEQSYRLKMLDVSSQLQFDDAHYAPVVAKRAVHNVTGKPILFSNGEPVAIRRGINRNYFVFSGGAPDEQITSVTSFMSLAAPAGQCLSGLPTGVSRFLWHDWLQGFPRIGDKGMWVSALFELAWQSSTGSSLAAERLAWSETTNTPLEAVTHPNVDSPSEGVDEIPDAAAHWYSVIDDLVAASIAAVDILIAAADDDQSECD